LQVQRGKRVENLDDHEFSALLANYQDVLVDLGTGDGKFVLRSARAAPQTLCIGLDAAGENMARSAGQALRKPARGGAANTLYVVAAVENLPQELRGIANRITVNFPWGSLLRAVVTPLPEIFAGILELGKPDARLECLINYHVFADPAYIDRLQLPTLDNAFLENQLLPAYEQAGVEMIDHGFIEGDPPHRTSWGQRLTKGSNRPTLALIGRLAGDRANST